MIMRAKCKITVYDCLFDEYEFTIKPNEKVKILSLDYEGVHIIVDNNDGYISYKQFKNGLIEE